MLDFIFCLKCTVRRNEQILYNLVVYSVDYHWVIQNTWTSSHPAGKLKGVMLFPVTK